jgi:hypothetical protein
VRHRSIIIALIVLFLGATRVASAQSTTDPSTSSPVQSNTAAQTNQGDGFIGDWLSMVTETQCEQPHNSGLVSDNYGVSKGFEMIPATRWEVILAIPAYVLDNPDSPKDGFGECQFLVKYRILSSNEEHGNYILTASKGKRIEQMAMWFVIAGLDCVTAFVAVR